MKRIAVPINAYSMRDALADIGEANKVADVIELRLDAMQAPALEALLAKCHIPVIVTNRPGYQGGNFQGSEEKRIKPLQQAIEFGVSYVDIEAGHVKQLRKTSATRFIASYHNFEFTPQNLQDIRDGILKEGADIVKIAATAKSPYDSLRMLELIAASANSGIPLIGICMGVLGIETRVLGPLLGGYLTYASLSEGKESAPGQLTVGELRSRWGLLLNAK